MWSAWRRLDCSPSALLRFTTGTDLTSHTARSPSSEQGSKGRCPSRRVQTFGISVPHGNKKSCLGSHIKYIVTCNHKKTHNVLSKCMILCWAVFIAILGCLWPVGCRLDTPVGKQLFLCSQGIFPAGHCLPPSWCFYRSLVCFPFKQNINHS